MKGQAIDYLPEELAWIEAHKDWPRKTLHAGFCARFRRTDVSVDALKQLCLRKGWKTGRTGCFPKGNEPMNKGKKMPFNANSARTQFKKGDRPHTWRGAGHERIDAKDGYVIMIVDETNPWTGAPTRPVHKHRWLWEKKHGPIPKGMVLKCLSGDKTNCDPSNWELIPQAMMPRLSGRWGIAYDDAPDELKPTLMATAKLEYAAREAKKRAKS
ncbi:HNH endonuclease signature motif containing protein [Acidimangrovimonas sediminis]|uniref:HNH endonuclease signature motif containing protein n=1 Tax=Acidimangrovimonas sediminis TaxID=2056283 RepID=UPI000C8096F8|nr:HNH endonuclease signature motif containing protein [Acidimangrovimonas sediminis]